MSKDDVLLDDATFDAAATPVGKKKCCSRYREHVLQNAKKVKEGTTGTWTNFKHVTPLDCFGWFFLCLT